MERKLLLFQRTSNQTLQIRQLSRHLSFLGHSSQCALDHSTFRSRSLPCHRCTGFEIQDFLPSRWWEKTLGKWFSCFANRNSREFMWDPPNKLEKQLFGWKPITSWGHPLSLLLDQKNEPSSSSRWIFTSSLLSSQIWLVMVQTQKRAIIRQPFVNPNKYLPEFNTLAICSKKTPTSLANKRTGKTKKKTLQKSLKIIFNSPHPSFPKKNPSPSPSFYEPAPVVPFLFPPFWMGFDPGIRHEIHKVCFQLMMPLLHSSTTLPYAVDGRSHPGKRFKKTKILMIRKECNKEWRGNTSWIAVVCMFWGRSRNSVCVWMDAIKTAVLGDVPVITAADAGP